MVTPAPELAKALEAFHRGDVNRARLVAERQLSIAPSPHWEHLLGLIHCRTGDPAGGAEHLRRAAEAEPDNAAHRVMLARALIDSGRAAEVLEMPRPGAEPAAPELWATRGEAALACGRREAAVESWAKVTEAWTADWRAWNNYGDALASLQRWGEAAAGLGKAVQLNPGNIGLRRNLAAALANGGFFEESVTEFQDVVNADPTDAASAVMLARGLLTLRRNDEALAAADEAVRRGVNADDLDELRGHCLVSTRPRRSIVGFLAAVPRTVQQFTSSV
jgi:tetratricopeptide (TPR) repeat protein